MQRSHYSAIDPLRRGVLLTAFCKVLEYTLFMPGLFLDYLATPYQTAKHIAPLDLIFDYQNCRQFMVEGHEDAIMTLTTAADTAAIVARAVDYGGEWPVNGGIRGNRVTFSQIVKLGEKVRGNESDGLMLPPHPREKKKKKKT